ncbi:MAG: glycoside hydrolase family 31 [Acidobacteria bacterium]|nr:glycoside hydrolase family 31 [Acidobacteriota bacterium]
MRLRLNHGFAVALALLAPSAGSHAAEIRSAGQPARLDIRLAGDHSIRITLRPLSYGQEFPFSPSLVERRWPAPAISLREIDAPLSRRVGGLQVTVRPNPLAVAVWRVDGTRITDLTFDPDTGNVSFTQGNRPILGMGEGGPRMDPKTWREQQLEFDRRGRFHEMVPRWQAQAYGSRNPVPLLVGTEGWGLYVATPWVQVDLTPGERGVFLPWKPPDAGQDQRTYTAQVQGRPPVDGIVSGVLDMFVFDARDPAVFMKEVSLLTGSAAMPPKWSLGFMQSHRTLEDENQLIRIVDTFREKKMPLDSVVYLGTGFCPRGWNTKQPSFTFNPEVFKRDPGQTIADLHQRNVKVIVHIVPWGRDEGLPTLQGTIPPAAGEPLNESHILNYWKQHLPLIGAGIDAFWPDEGDWFNLFERIKRHQLYYQGPISTTPNVRPWSLHRNGYIGVARWGGWVWSGDTDSAWRTLEGQIMVGLNHSLSLSPYWGSDTGGFYPNAELTGELYARWFQFSSFTPSFRSHGRTWWTRLPWGWGLSEMGPLENGRNNPLPSELNNPAIEPVCRKYAELRYQLLPYTYSLASEATGTGMPLMRALWLHYPDDPHAVENGREYLWGRDLLIAPVYEKGAKSREVYLPRGDWFDWWTNHKEAGGRSVSRQVDLATMPIYVRAGAIIPVDPVRQYTSQPVDGPTTIRIYGGANGQFTLYEDDGYSLDYLQGKAVWTRMMWDDTARRLTIEPGTPAGVKGGGTAAQRTFQAHLLPAGTIKTVTYSGRRVVVTF